MFYVETKNLDGETNLKLKSVPKEMIDTFKSPESLQRLEGSLNIEAPNNRIYKFDGNFDMAKIRSSQRSVPNAPPTGDSINSDVAFSSLVPLSNDNVALRGMSLRNTEYVTGIVVYTGHDSKIQMNSAGATYKTSNITRQTNKLLLQVLGIQICASMLGSAIGTTWMISNLDDATYLSFNRDDQWNTNAALLFI